MKDIRRLPQILQRMKQLDEAGIIAMSSHEQGRGEASEWQPRIVAFVCN